MGITNFSIKLLEKALSIKPGIKSVCELGSQNLYINNESRPPFADGWYHAQGIPFYSCIDLAGDNRALQLDLSEVLKFDRQFDLVTDLGTSEHVVIADGTVQQSFHNGHIHSVYPVGVRDHILGYYHCWLNKHNLLKTGGMMVNENPKTNNWPGHGHNYLGENFYSELCQVSGYELIESGSDAAMGNTVDGWNVFGILKKVGDDFPTFERFKQLPIFDQ